MRDLSVGGTDTRRAAKGTHEPESSLLLIVESHELQAIGIEKEKDDGEPWVTVTHDSLGLVSYSGRRSS